MAHQQTGRALIACFAAVAAAFTAGMAASEVFSVRIRAAVRDITGNSSPSISSVSAMRGTLRELEIRALDHVNACERGRCAPDPQADGLRRALRDEWLSYRALPTFPGEAERWPAIDDLLTRLERALTLTFAVPRTVPEASTALREVRPSFDALDQALAGIAELDHAQGLELASKIDGLARRAVATSAILDLLAIALTALTAVLAVRFVRRNERVLRERADELDQFAGRVAHDIKSPLAATAVALHVARRDGAERGRTALARADGSLRRVQQLVDGLLEFARAGAGRSREASVELRDVLEEVVAELQPAAEDARVSLFVDLVEADPVACSPGVLASLVSNLVRNSIVHMGGSPVREVRIRARPLPPARAVRVEVEDTGPGVPRELGDQVFEPFVRGPGAGRDSTGLGLATAKRLVVAHGGRIGFAPAPPRGTIFWFELPSASRAGQPAGT